MARLNSKKLKKNCVYEEKKFGWIGSWIGWFYCKLVETLHISVSTKLWFIELLQALSWMNCATITTTKSVSIAALSTKTEKFLQTIHRDRLSRTNRVMIVELYYNSLIQFQVITEPPEKGNILIFYEYLLHINLQKLQKSYKFALTYLKSSWTINQLLATSPKSSNSYNHLDFNWHQAWIAKLNSYLCTQQGFLGKSWTPEDPRWIDRVNYKWGHTYCLALLARLIQCQNDIIIIIVQKYCMSLCIWSQ